MPKFEVVKMIEKITTVNERDKEISTALVEQVRIRDDETRTRPFLTLELKAGMRTYYINVGDAVVLFDQLAEIMPTAKSELERTQRESRERLEKRKLNNAKRNSGNVGLGGHGKTAKKREREEKGEVLTYEQRKKMRSERDRELRRKMQGAGK